MADPTFASVWNQAGLALKLPNAINLFGHSTTPNVADIQDALTTAIDGNFTPAALGAVANLRRTLGATVTPDTLRALWVPFLQEAVFAADLKSLAGASNGAMLDGIRQYMVDNVLLLKGRGMTFGTPSAGVGNVGVAGAMLRCTVDKDGWPLPTGPEAKSAKVTQDALTGVRKYAEVWTFEGSLPGPDNLDWQGSGLLAQGVASAHPLTTSIIKNPSFDQSDATADNATPGSTTAVTNWVMTGSAANFRLRSASGYAFGGYPGQPATTYGLEIVASDAISQTLATVSPGVSFGSGPHLIAIRWKRKASATGTLTLALGASSVSATIGSASNDAWNILYIALDSSCYFDTFNATDLKLTITAGTLATGTVVVDHVVVCPMVNVDGTYYLPVSGSTPWLKDDIYTWTDADGGTRAILSYLLWLAFGADGWLPSAPDATQVTASGGRTLTYANSGSADTITASSGSFISDGFKPGMLVASAGTSSNNLTTGPLVTVTATVLTFGAGTSLTNEGPLSSTATLNATAPIPDPV